MVYYFDEVQGIKLQLQQVEAALLSDPDNKELQKLKIDLEEVIDLTLDLKLKAEEAANQPEYRELTTNYEEDEITKSLLAVEQFVAKNKKKKLWRVYGKMECVEQFVAKNKKKKLWRVGDICMAKWNDNNQYYEARIDSINPDGQNSQDRNVF
ncbi:hypothetical protein QE152_g28339 [Popillia japonica]|uniref:Tudor domain-containing protein n=1 Tax=Popillia japonica TaxID=7064 RepID=A0AAW1JMN5_POPJA